MKNTRIHQRLMEGPGRADADKALPMNRPNFKGTTDWTTGKTTPLKRNSPLLKRGALAKHNKKMDKVLTKRAARAAGTKMGEARIGRKDPVISPERVTVVTPGTQVGGGGPNPGAQSGDYTTHQGIKKKTGSRTSKPPTSRIFDILKKKATGTP
tara:strand:+ start:192 stop:653 length:462 start_codon:yes stop_codon:yes gene_type:complete